MAQRVSIAAALAGEPDVLLADEPTTALDVTVQAEILDVLRDLGIAVILVTHDWGVLVDLCQRGIVVYAGQVVEQGSIEEILQAPRHPYTRALLGSNPYFAEPGRPLPTIAGTVLPPGEWPTGCHFWARCPLAAPICQEGPVPLVAAVGRGGLTRCIRQGEAAGVAP
jgi:peptide/nickel transport system permease protein